MRRQRTICTLFIFLLTTLFVTCYKQTPEKSLEIISLIVSSDSCGCSDTVDVAVDFILEEIDEDDIDIKWYDYGGEIIGSGRSVKFVAPDIPHLCGVRVWVECTTSYHQIYDEMKTYIRTEVIEIERDANHYLTSPEDIFISGNYAYLNSIYGTYPIKIFDITNPAIPMQVGYIDNSCNVGDVFVDDTIAYISKTDILYFINVVNPSSPVKIDSLELNTGYIKR